MRPPLAAPSGRWWRLANIATICAGVLTTLVATYAFCAEPGLPVVDPRDMQVAARLDDVPGDWMSVALLAALGMVASAGLPRSSDSGVAARRGAGQVAAAVAAVCGAIPALLLTNIWTFGPDDPCRYPSCWPAEAQTVAIASPVLLAVASLVAVALLSRKLRHSVRALVPAMVWLMQVLLLHLAWEPWLLPMFLASPP